MRLAPILTGLLTVGCASSQRLTNTPAEYIAEGACPGEYCCYGRWTLTTAATVLSHPNRNAAVLHRVSPGTIIRAETGFVAVQQIGRALITGHPPDYVTNVSDLRPGDTLEILDYVGEGYWNSRLRGVPRLIMGYWDSLGTKGARTLRPQRQEWWVFVSPPDTTRKGWVLIEGVRRTEDPCA